jgi:hypothetical protein
MARVDHIAMDATINVGNAKLAIRLSLKTRLPEHLQFESITVAAGTQ